MALEDGATCERAIGDSDCDLAGEAEEEVDIRMTQEEEGMAVDVHTPDKALPKNKMKESFLSLLQCKTQAAGMHNRICILRHRRTPSEG